MFKIHYQAKAKSDLIKIWEYTYKKHGEDQAEKYHDQLEEGFQCIQENPEIGGACDYIRLGYRSYRIGRHFVMYKISNETIHVIRVLHERMDFVRHL